MTQTQNAQHTPGPWNHSLTTNGNQGIYGADMTRIMVPVHADRIVTD
jgi:hypothetical protein